MSNMKSEGKTKYLGDPMYPDKSHDSQKTVKKS